MKDTIIATFFLTTLLGILGGLAMTAEIQTQRATMANYEQRLADEQLKREYFEWRESKATGHTVDKSKFPRYAEMTTEQ